MAEKIPSISKINALFQNKEMKPSELFEQVYEGGEPKDAKEEK